VTDDVDKVATAERGALNAALESIRSDRGWSATPSFEEIISRWETFVREVETGYKLSIYDYTNDLTFRDHIADILKALPDGELRRAVHARVAPLDNRLRRATLPSETPLAPGSEPTDHWWWFRIPRKLESELRNDLADDGII
jgi:hypothetical protein